MYARDVCVTIYLREGRGLADVDSFLQCIRVHSCLSPGDTRACRLVVRHRGAFRDLAERVLEKWSLPR